MVNALWIKKNARPKVVAKMHLAAIMMVRAIKLPTAVVPMENAAKTWQIAKEKIVAKALLAVNNIINQEI